MSTVYMYDIQRVYGTTYVMVMSNVILILSTFNHTHIVMTNPFVGDILGNGIKFQVDARYKVQTKKLEGMDTYRTDRWI